MPYPPRLPPPVAGLLALLVLGAPCCGSPCDTWLEFNAPPPDMRLRPSEAATYDLFKDVWAQASYCDGDYGSEGRASFPWVEVSSERPEVASVSLEWADPEQQRRKSLLRVDAHAPGRTTILLRTRAEEDCETVYDATHFVVTVDPSATPTTSLVPMPQDRLPRRPASSTAIVALASAPDPVHRSAPPQGTCSSR